MSSLTKVNCYLNVYLKERIFAFIEHDTCLVDKKHAKKIFLLKKIVPLVHVKLYRILYKSSSDKIISELNIIRGINVMRMLMKYAEQFVCLKSMHTLLQCICNQCRLFFVYTKNTNNTELTQFSYTLYSFYNDLYDKLTIINKNQYIDTKITL